MFFEIQSGPLKKIPWNSSLIVSFYFLSHSYSLFLHRISREVRNLEPAFFRSAYMDSPCVWWVPRKTDIALKHMWPHHRRILLCRPSKSDHLARLWGVEWKNRHQATLAHVSGSRGNKNDVKNSNACSEALCISSGRSSRKHIWQFELLPYYNYYQHFSSLFKLLQWNIVEFFIRKAGETSFFCYCFTEKSFSWFLFRNYIRVGICTAFNFKVFRLSTPALIIPSRPYKVFQ